MRAAEQCKMFNRSSSKRIPADKLARTGLSQSLFDVMDRVNTLLWKLNGMKF